MPNGRGDEAPVTWGRFQESQRRQDDRFADIENEISSLAEKLDKRKDRSWQLLTIVLTGVLVPLLVTGILALIHHLQVI